MNRRENNSGLSDLKVSPLRQFQQIFGREKDGDFLAIKFKVERIIALKLALLDEKIEPENI